MITHTSLSQVKVAAQPCASAELLYIGSWLKNRVVDGQSSSMSCRLMSRSTHAPTCSCCIGTLIFLPPVIETRGASLASAVLSSLRRVGLPSAVDNPEPAPLLIAALVSNCSTCKEHNIAARRS
jgi:hypothetical protein